MMKKEPGSVVKVALCMLFVLSLCLLPSCKKSEEPAPTPGPTGADVNEPVAAAPEHPSAAPSAVLGPEAVPAALTTAGAGGLVPIELELPKPMFVGTPQDIKDPDIVLEKPLGHPRPPFLAPPGTRNIALGKPVSGSDEEPIIGELDYITDGDMEAADGSYVELGPFQQYVTIDLEGMYDIYAIFVWHYHKQGRAYKDVIVNVANDPDFISYTTVFNNDRDSSAGFGVGKDLNYVETNEGKLIDVLSQGIKARYVRLYSNGNNANDLNHYIEVAVFGKPAS